TSSSQRGRLGSIVAQCQVLITRRLMRNFSARAKNAKAVNRSFSLQATSSRISYATLAMAMSRNSSQEDHGWHSTRPARFYEMLLSVLTGPRSLDDFSDVIWINSHSGQRQYPF